MGTENNYTPVQCFDAQCPNRTPHMHCPFCVKTESYQDPVILKAHYRVKHVDKGIEFAGLKILRCCDHCDIVGVIKGEKKFKRAHWHCYRCRNGFNRRDEAIKHYKTHFRNPQTTFQIQISQEVNTTVNYNTESQTAATNIYTDQESGQAVLTQAADAASTPNSHLVTAGLGAKGEGAVQVSIGAHETIEAEGQTIMIIQSGDAHLDNAFPEQIVHTEEVALPPDKEESETSEEGECYRLIIEEIPSNIIHNDLTCLNCGNNIQDVSSLEGKNGALEKKYESAEIRCQRLEEENLQLKSQIEQLKSLYETAVKELEQCRERDRVLHQQFVSESEKSLPELRQAAISQFTDLLDQQLASLRQTYLSQVAATVVRLQLPVSTSANGDTAQVDFATLSAKVLEGLTAEKARDQQADRVLQENGTEGIAMSLEPALVMCVNNPLPEDTQDELDQTGVTVHELQVDSGDVHELHVELAHTEPKQEAEEEEIQLGDERDQTGDEAEYEPAEKRRKEA